MIINYSSKSRFLSSFQQVNNVIRAVPVTIAYGKTPFELVIETVLVTKLVLASTLTGELKL